eukprot:132161_1
MSLFCFIILCINIAISTNLDSSYTVDTTLTIANSPYYVVLDVSVSSSTLFIQNGVEIIFKDDYFITVSSTGIINVGCNNYDTSSIISGKGLADTNTFTYIHGNNTKNRIGGINIQQYSATSIFCNVLFENLDYGLQEQLKPYNPLYAPYIIDNCEFNNVNYATKNDDGWANNDQYWPKSNLTDSYLHDLTYANNNGNI